MENFEDLKTLILPKMPTEIGKKTFSYSASKLFNTLPAKLSNLKKK